MSSWGGATQFSTRLIQKAGKLFSSMLKRNRTLRHLDLSRNELGTQTGVAFATALQVNQTLESLALGGNGMGPNVAKRMAQTLKQNTSLQSLDLSGNALGYATVDGGNPSGEGLVLGDGLRRYSHAVYSETILFW